MGGCRWEVLALGLALLPLLSTANLPPLPQLPNFFMAVILVGGIIILS